MHWHGSNATFPIGPLCFVLLFALSHLLLPHPLSCALTRAPPHLAHCFGPIHDVCE